MRTVLLIDDDQESRDVLVTWLKSDGWEVIEAVNGEQGLELAAEKQPMAVICDLLMPRCNGFQVCRTIRSSGGALRHATILVTTSSGYPTDRKNALEAGADDVCVKPLKQTELLNRLNELVQYGSQTDFVRHQGQKARNGSAFTAAAKSLPDPSGSPVTARFWGVRGSIATPGRNTAMVGGNTTCVEVRADGQLIILDAGTGIRPLGLELVAEFKNRPINTTLLLTHTHWDHIQGFPFFVPAYNPRNNLQILGYEGAREGLGNTLSHQMESPYFPISLQEMPSYISFQELRDMEFNIGKVAVKAQFVNHPGVCVGYRLNTSKGSICFIPDNESFQRQKSEVLTKGDENYDEVLEYARQEDQRLIEFIQGADILIMDAQYDASEYASKVGWGHTCVDDTVAIALRAGVKKLYLFHHDPGHDDKFVARMEAHARKLVAAAGESLEVEAAREGVVVTLRGKRARKSELVTEQN